MISYRFQVVSQLKDCEYIAGTMSANWCLQIIQADESFLNQVIYFDRCAFHVNVEVNKHDVWIRGTVRPQNQKSKNSEE